MDQQFNPNDYLIRIVDQTGKDNKYFYASMTKQQFAEVCKILNVKETDWD